MSLSFLIVLHELGHFIPAKLFKTRVEKFYLFFDVNFSLFKKKIGDTVYGTGDHFLARLCPVFKQISFASREDKVVL